MIEFELTKDLQRLTGLTVWPLLLPEHAQEGITLLRVSDAKVDTGLAQTALVEGRFQVTFVLVDDYERLLRLDNIVRQAWESVQHGAIGDWPVQAVRRGTVHQDMTPLENNRKQYRLIRDFIIVYPEDAT